MNARQTVGTAVRFLRWYFPAYFPLVVLPFLKWAVLWNAGVLTFVTMLPDFSFALLTFDIWAITTTLKRQPLRLDGTSPAWEIVVTFLVLHLVVYLLNVRAWFTDSATLLRVAVSFLAFATAGIGAFMILDVPPRHNVGV